MKEEDKKLLFGKLADDVWAIAKRLESTDRFKEVSDLKTISCYLHDLRSESTTEWYFKKSF